MKALVVSLESFQKGDIPDEVKEYIAANNMDIFTVLDESSKIKTNVPCADNKKSKRTQAILKLNKYGERCILTGTFMSKSPVNAYDQMNFLCPDFFPETIFEFSEKYEIKQKLQLSNRNQHDGRAQRMKNIRVQVTDKVWKFAHRKLIEAYKRGPENYLMARGHLSNTYGISEKNLDYIAQHREPSLGSLDELWDRIGDTCFKVKREDLFDLPPKIYRTINVELTAEQKKLYLQLQNERCTDNIAVENALGLYIRFQDICNGYEPVEKEDDEGNTTVELKPLSVNPKLDLLEELVEDIGKEQIVVWCSRTQLLYDAHIRLAKLGYNCGVYDGKIGRETRELYYEAFKNKAIQILFVNQASGAYGLDGLKEADYAIYLSNSYSVEQRQQSEDRIYRGEVKRNKYIIDLTCGGTCEDKVVRALQEGKELLDSGCVSSEIFKLEK